MGRPSTYSDTIFETICERMANGETLLKICRDDQMPDRATVLRWIGADDGKRRKYDVARRACVEFWSDEIIDIATDGSKDTKTDRKGRARCDWEWLGRSKLRVDTMFKLMRVIDPARYGDRLPEAVQARAMEIEQQQQLTAAHRADPPRIERQIFRPGELVMEANGNWVSRGADGLHARIRELEAALAGQQAPDREATLAPRLLEHDPGLPRRLDQDIARRMVTLIRDCVPTDGSRDPESILDECYSVIRDALQSHFGPTGEPMESLTAE